MECTIVSSLRIQNPEWNFKRYRILQYQYLRMGLESEEADSIRRGVDSLGYTYSMCINIYIYLSKKNIHLYM